MLKRAWSTEPGPVDKFGRRIMVASTGSRPGSTTTSAPGTPRRGDSPVRLWFLGGEVYGLDGFEDGLANSMIRSTRTSNGQPR